MMPLMSHHTAQRVISKLSFTFNIKRVIIAKQSIKHVPKERKNMEFFCDFLRAFFVVVYIKTLLSVSMWWMGTHSQDSEV